MMDKLKELERELDGPIEFEVVPGPYVNEAEDHMAFTSWGPDGTKIRVPGMTGKDPLAEAPIQEALARHELMEAKYQGGKAHDILDIESFSGTEGTMVHKAAMALKKVALKAGGEAGKLARAVSGKYPVAEWIRAYEGDGMFKRMERYITKTYVNAGPEAGGFLSSLGKYAKETFIDPFFPEDHAHRYATAGIGGD